MKTKKKLKTKSITYANCMLLKYCNCRFFQLRRISQTDNFSCFHIILFFSLACTLTLTWQFAHIPFFYFFTHTFLANTLAFLRHSSARRTHTDVFSPTHIIYTSTSLLLSNIILRCHALTCLTLSCVYCFMFFIFFCFCYSLYFFIVFILLSPFWNRIKCTLIVSN